MKQVPPPVPIPQPPAPTPGLAADVVASGLPVHPEERVRLFSPDQWERFIQEWVDSLRDDYELVERCGGAGDMGRDIIATVKAGNGAWDNYQCKHYQRALAPGDVWVELGKLAYYTLKGEYSWAGSSRGFEVIIEPPDPAPMQTIAVAPLGLWIVNGS